MKTTITFLTIICGFAVILTAQAVELSDTHAEPSVLGGIEQIGAGIYRDMPTNVSVAPYATYVRKSPTHWGGGLLVAYNVNDYVGAVVGVDYISQFLGVSGGIQLSYPIHPIKEYPNFSVRPFAISAIGTPLSGHTGNDGGIDTINSAGMALDFGHCLGGHFAIGGAYGTRTGAGTYNGGYLNTFLAWTKGF